MNVDIINRIMFENQITLRYLRDRDSNIVKVETKKLAILTHISTNNITWIEKTNLCRGKISLG